MSNIRTTEILEKVTELVNGEMAMTVETNYRNKSVPNTIIGNGTVTVIDTNTENISSFLKAIVITGNGNQGRCDVKINGVTVLPQYFTVQSRTATAGGLNLEVKSGDTLTIQTTDRGASSETFVGISYYEVEV